MVGSSPVGAKDDFNSSSEIDLRELASKLYMDTKGPEWMQEISEGLEPIQVKALHRHLNFVQAEDFNNFNDAIRDVLLNGKSKADIEQSYPDLGRGFSQIVDQAFDVRENPAYDLSDRRAALSLVRSARDAGGEVLKAQREHIGTTMDAVTDRNASTRYSDQIYGYNNNGHDIGPSQDARWSVLGKISDDDREQIPKIGEAVEGIARADYTRATEALDIINEQIIGGASRTELAGFIDSTLRGQIRDDGYTDMLKQHALTGDPTSKKIGQDLFDRASQWNSEVKEGMTRYYEIPQLAEKLHGLPQAEWAANIPRGMSPENLGVLQENMVKLAESDLREAKQTIARVYNEGRSSPVRSEADAEQVTNKLYRSTDAGLGDVASVQDRAAYRGIISDFIKPDPDSNTPTYASLDELKTGLDTHRQQLDDHFDTLKTNIDGVFKAMGAVAPGASDVVLSGPKQALV